MTARDDDDLPEIRQGLADRATELFEHLYDNPTKRGRNEWRWGRKGSLVLYLRGRGGPHWKSYEADQGGDMLAAIQHALGLDFSGTLDWARGYLGMPQRDRQPRYRTEPSPKQEKPAADYDAEQTAKARRAAELAAAAVPIAGTVAERYLHKRRGIQAAVWPDALGFADTATVKRCAGWTWWHWLALIVRATDAAGAVTGLQLVALQSDGSAAKHWEHDGKLKLSFGTLAGTAVRLVGDDRALLLAEGPETALSCWWATGITTWCNLGSIARAPIASVPISRLIVVCADDDARDAQSNKALRDAIRGWRREGRRVVMVKPHRLTQRDKSDFNDVLRADGPDAVRARILAPIEDQPAAEDRLSVAEARRQAAKLIDGALNALLNPDPYARHGVASQDAAPFKALRLTTGIGKTEIAIRRIVREAADGAKIIYLVPTHRLGAEMVGRIEAEARRQGANVTVDVWRGRDRERPDDPDTPMCSESDTIAAARAAKVDPGEVCKLCPHAAECPYLAQFGRSASIWVAAHDQLWHAMPPPLQGADLVVIDEGFATRGLAGFSGTPRLLTEAEVQAELMPARDMLVAALRDHPDGGLQRERLIAAGLTVESARVARKFEWAAKVTVDLRSLSWPDAKRVLNRAAKQNRLIPRFAALLHEIEDLLASDGTLASGRAVIGNYKIDETTVRGVRLYGTERIKAGWRRTPTLHIDATIDVELLRLRVPQAEMVGEVEAATPHMRVVQYPDKAFGKLALRNHRFLFKVWDWAVAYAARQGGDWGVILPKEAKDAIPTAREVPSFIRLHHFGATRGIDTLKDVRGLVVVGRPMEGPDGVERIAGALSGRAVDPIPGDWYPAEIVQLRARDGSVATVEADRHPDPLAEAVRASIAEGELLQSVGRARGVNRTEADPVEVVLLGNVPVPGLPIDELRTWKLPSVDDEIFARFGAALESSGDAATVAGMTDQRVKDGRRSVGFSYKRYLYGNSTHLCSAIYQIAGPGRRRQRVVFDRRWIADCRAWLADRLGPLAYFVEDVAEPVAAEPVAESSASDCNWLGALEIAAPLHAQPARLIPLGSVPIEALFIAAGIRAPPPAVTGHCTWFVDTTGDVFRRCGEPIHDGLELCLVHRFQRASAILGTSLRPPMPFGPFPTASPEGSGSIVAVIAAPARGERRAPRF